MTHGALWMGGRADAGELEDGTDAVFDVWVDVGMGPVAAVAMERGEADLGALLKKACAAPALGAPRRPARVRVANAALAAEVERAGLGIAVEVGPTPEVDVLAADFIGQMRPVPTPERNFLGQAWREATGAQRAKVQAAGAKLLAGEPWRRVRTSELVRVRAAALGLEEGVVVVLGEDREAYGFLLFRDAGEADRYFRLAREGRFSQGPPLGGPCLVWDVTPPRRRKGTPKSEVGHLAANWDALVADGGEMTLLVAVAEALARFDRARGAKVGPVGLALAEPERARGAGPLLTVAEVGRDAGAAPPAVRPDRNDPCWCGSGKKYKKCHLDADRDGAREGAAAPSGRFKWFDVSARMYARLARWVAAKAPGWLVPEGEDALVAEPRLRPSTRIFVMPLPGSGGVTAAERFRAEEGGQLSADERRWLDANVRSAWLSYWTVVSVEPGRSITLRDVYSEAVHTVTETRASQTVVPHELLCARVVTMGEAAYVDIAHPRTLGPREAAILRAELAPLLGFTKVKAVPLAKLRAPKTVLRMISAWEEAVAAQDAAFGTLKLQNTDGEALVLVRERFAPSAPEEVVRAVLDGLPGAVPPEAGEATWYVDRAGAAKHAEWESTRIARVSFEAGALTVETNSRERADRVRAALAEALGATLGEGQREETESDALMAEAAAGAPGAASVEETPEMQQAVVELKAKMYATWPDQPLEALGGRTAREAVRTGAGRKQVEILLDEMELLEARGAAGARYDFDILRRALGLLVAH